MTETQKLDKGWGQPDKAWEIIKFIPIDGTPALHSSAPVAALAFSVSQLRKTYLVESIKISGEYYLELKLDNFPDAIGECVKRMKENSHVNYTIEQV